MIFKLLLTTKILECVFFLAILVAPKKLNNLINQQN